MRATIFNVVLMPAFAGRMQAYYGAGRRGNSGTLLAIQLRAVGSNPTRR